MQMQQHRGARGAAAPSCSTHRHAAPSLVAPSLACSLRVRAFTAAQASTTASSAATASSSGRAAQQLHAVAPQPLSRCQWAPRRRAQQQLCRSSTPSGEQGEPSSSNGEHPFPEEQDFDLLSNRVAELTAELKEELRGCSIYLVGMMGSGKSTVSCCSWLHAIVLCGDVPWWPGPVPPRPARSADWARCVV